ncbi:MAG: ClpX C4-type zinc finger protein [Nitratireductor sp.]
MRQKQFGNAMITSVLTYLLAESMGEEQLKNGAISWLKLSLSAKDSKYTSQSESELSCSFCGKQQPEVKLAAGSGGIICNMCAKNFTAIFEKDDR